MPCVSRAHTGRASGGRTHLVAALPLCGLSEPLEVPGRAEQVLEVHERLFRRHWTRKRIARKALAEAVPEPQIAFEQDIHTDSNAHYHVDRCLRPFELRDTQICSGMG